MGERQRERGGGRERDKERERGYRECVREIDRAREGERGGLRREGGREGA